MSLELLKSRRAEFQGQLTKVEKDMADLAEQHGKLAVAREQLRGAVAAMDNVLSASQPAPEAPKSEEQEVKAPESNG